MQGYNNFPTDIGTFCLLANFRNFLKYYNLDVTEVWLGGIIGYQGFYYTTNDLLDKDVLNGRNGDFQSMFNRLEEQLLEPLQKDYLDIGESALDHIEDLLINKVIPLVWINDFYLEHTNYYKLAAYWSLVAVLEINKDSITYFDNGVRTINRDAFIKALDNSGKGTAIYPMSATLKWKEKDHIIMARGLKYIVENLKSNVNNNGMYYGIAGIEKFAEDLINYEDLAFIYQIFYLLNNPSGLAITRKNISELCDEIHLKWSNICTKECRDAYESLSESWRMVANLLFKVSRIGDKALQSRVVERVRNIIGYESEGIGLLESLAMELEGLDV